MDFNPISVVQIVLAILLCTCVMLQHRTSGLTATFGGSGAVHVQRRGAEKIIYQLTWWISGLFFLLAVAQWYLI